jgi:hypothetical protein
MMPEASAAGPFFVNRVRPGMLAIGADTSAFFLDEIDLKFEQ